MVQDKAILNCNAGGLLTSNESFPVVQATLPARRQKGWRQTNVEYYECNESKIEGVQRYAIVGF